MDLVSYLFKRLIWLRDSILSRVSLTLRFYIKGVSKTIGFLGIKTAFPLRSLFLSSRALANSRLGFFGISKFLKSGGFKSFLGMDIEEDGRLL